MDGHAARRILGNDLEAVAKPLVGYRAAEGGDAVLNLDAHARARRPVELVELRLDGGLDLGIGMRALRAQRRGQKSLEEVGARNDANDIFAPQHRQPFDATANHPIHRLAELGALLNRLDVAGHHFPDLSPVLMHIGLGEPPAAEQEFEPAGTFALTSELVTAKEVALAQDSAQLMLGVEDEQRAHPRTQHRLDRVADARILSDAGKSPKIEQLKPASIAANLAAPPSRAQRTRGRTVFIGHGGHSSEWLKLEKFLSNRLQLSPVEFNSTSAAGVAISERLRRMLDQANFAFLILTGEDEQATGKFNPRLNVVHEAGLFQGRLGFEKAIILREEGCEDFSNVNGLGDIRFPKGKVGAAFEEIRGVLEREGINREGVETGSN